MRKLEKKANDADWVSRQHGATSVNNVDMKKNGVSWVLRQRGAGLVKAIVLIPVMLVLAAAVVFAFYEGRKAYWDYKVRVMCEKDGGVFIEGKIIISDIELESLGTVAGYTSIPPKSLANPKSPVFYTYRETVIRESSPRVTKWEEKIFRRNDESAIATVIRFRRFGGDLPTYAHPSHFSCPDKLEVLSKRQAIFQKQGG